MRVSPAGLRSHELDPSSEGQVLLAAHRRADDVEDFDDGRQRRIAQRPNENFGGLEGHPVGEETEKPLLSRFLKTREARLLTAILVESCAREHDRRRVNAS